MVEEKVKVCSEKGNQRQESENWKKVKFLSKNQNGGDSIMIVGETWISTFQ